jgi:hypothetical protein
MAIEHRLKRKRREHKHRCMNNYVSQFRIGKGYVSRANRIAEFKMLWNQRRIGCPRP